MLYKIFTLIAIILTLCLAVWQLKRGTAKQEILEQYYHAQNQPGIFLNNLSEIQKLPNFSKVCLRGEFDNQHVLFLDNQIYQDQFGYQVILPFVLMANQSSILINLGWIPGDLNRKILPNIAKISRPQQICGYLKKISQKPFLLGNPELSSHWPLRIQRLWPPDLQNLLPNVILTPVLYLDPQATMGFIREWKIINLTPARHFAYAIQWLILMFLIIGIYSYAQYQKK